MSFVRRLFAFIPGLVVMLFMTLLSLTVNVSAVSAATDQQSNFNNIISKGIIFANMNDPGALCQTQGSCSLSQILQVAVNVVTFILGISGSIVLLMFIYGGTVWILSRGDAKHVQEGKDTMVRAITGFAIIVLSYSLINFLVAAVVGDAPGGTLEETVNNALDEKSNLNTVTPPAP